MRGWIALGIREGLSFKELAWRSGENRKTLSRWNKVFREEAASLETPEQDGRSFVDLIERASSKSSRIEIVVRGERRIVVDGSAIVEALVRVLAAVERC